VSAAAWGSDDSFCISVFHSSEVKYPLPVLSMLMLQNAPPELISSGTTRTKSSPENASEEV
jgi:hypothetical protein